MWTRQWCRISRVWKRRSRISDSTRRKGSLREMTFQNSTKFFFLRSSASACSCGACFAYTASASSCAHPTHKAHQITRLSRRVLHANSPTHEGLDRCTSSSSAPICSYHSPKHTCLLSQQQVVSQPMCHRSFQVPVRPRNSNLECMHACMMSKHEHEHSCFYVQSRDT